MSIIHDALKRIQDGDEESDPEAGTPATADDDAPSARADTDPPPEGLTDMPDQPPHDADDMESDAPDTEPPPLDDLDDIFTDDPVAEEPAESSELGDDLDSGDEAPAVSANDDVITGEVLDTEPDAGDSADEYLKANLPPESEQDEAAEISAAGAAVKEAVFDADVEEYPEDEFPLDDDQDEDERAAAVLAQPARPARARRGPKVLLLLLMVIGIGAMGWFYMALTDTGGPLVESPAVARRPPPTPKPAAPTPAAPAPEQPAQAAPTAIPAPAARPTTAVTPAPEAPASGAPEAAPEPQAVAAAPTPEPAPEPAPVAPEPTLAPHTVAATPAPEPALVAAAAEPAAPAAATPEPAPAPGPEPEPLMVAEAPVPAAPAAPETAMAPPPAPASPVDLAAIRSGIKINAIRYGDEEPRAIVNLQRVFEGDSVAGVRVVKILRDRIEFDAGGTTFTMRF